MQSSRPSVASVIEQMDALVQPLSANDGVACFARLYLAVTQGVQAQLTTVTFADPRFLAELDTRFAGLFFSAAAADPSTMPRAWRPLFEARGRSGIAPLQFALAGMNAHINRDLPVALVATCEALGLSVDEGTPQHADYLRVNEILAVVEQQVKDEFLGGWLRRLDRVVHRIDRLDDVVAMWDVRRARDAAWTNGEALWALRSDAALSASYVDTLDRTVGFAGRGLLIPTETRLIRLARSLHLI